MIESKLDPGRGAVVTLLVHRGRLKVGDAIVAGEHMGRVRAMNDYRGQRVEEATPGMPVEILGFDGVPGGGRELPRRRERARGAPRRQRARASGSSRRRSPARPRRRVSLEDVLARAERGEKELNLVVKADVAGSLEALADEIARLPHEQVTVNIIRDGVGGISESDVMLAAASDAVVIGFNVRPVGNAAPGGRPRGRRDPHLLGDLQHRRGAARRDGGPARGRRRSRSRSAPPRCARPSRPRASARSPART